MTTATATHTVEMDAAQATTAARQISPGDMLAISGGRKTLAHGALVLPVSNGYRVVVRLTVWDVYEVSREFHRGGKVFVKGTEMATAGTLSSVAYRASCFHNVDFGDEA